MKVVFLDRDGVINEFPGNGNYVTKVKDFRFIPRSVEAIKILTEQGYTLFVVSNQAGVGKGVYIKNKLSRITKNMLQNIEEAGGKIRKVYYCTHRSEENCSCRKPGIGSILNAMQSMNKSIRSAKKTFFIGDTKADILAGHNAGCTTIFVLSGREDRNHLVQWRVRPDFIAKDLFAATKIIQQYSFNGSHHRKPSFTKSK